jgi:UDP-N-acetylmuramoyl-tripeptide--D-alanyl-D-alanine ligase
MRMHASEVARITRGTLIGPDAVAEGISFDSRSLEPGQCFVALVADRDGHEFVGDAYRTGAPLCVVNRGALSDVVLPEGSSRVEVDDTLAALTVLGKWARDALDVSAPGHVIAVTGSAGKTSTKDFIAAILHAGCSLPFASEMSFNNDIGVPTTMLNAPDGCDGIVIEMGMRGFGEIARLCEVARPDVGVITSIGEAHSERVGGIEGVARAKGELLLSLAPTGVAIVNADDERAMQLAVQSQARKLTFGQSPTADVRYHVRAVEDDGRITMNVVYKDNQATVTVPVPGLHMASNAAAAIAAGIAIGIQYDVATNAVAHTVLSHMRMQWLRTDFGINILNDAYNANPDSMKAALETLSESAAVYRVAILGVMAEIENSPDRHQYIASYARELGVELWPVDTDLYGVPTMSVDDAARKIKELSAGTAVLLKGSRVAALERIVQLLGVAPPSKK